eukprot:UN04768
MYLSTLPVKQVKLSRTSSVLYTDIVYVSDIFYCSPMKSNFHTSRTSDYICAWKTVIFDEHDEFVHHRGYGSKYAIERGFIYEIISKVDLNGMFTEYAFLIILR